MVVLFYINVIFFFFFLVFPLFWILPFDTEEFLIPVFSVLIALELSIISLFSDFSTSDKDIIFRILKYIIL